MSNEIKVDVVAKSSGLDRVEKDARQAGARVGSALDKGFDEGAKAADRAGKRIRDDLGKTEKAAKDAGEGIGSALTEGLSGALDKSGGGPLSALTSSLGGLKSGGGKVGALGTGLVIGGLLMDGIGRAIEEKKVGAMVAAQTGQAAGSAGRMGDIAGDMFANSFGESIADVGDAMTAVFQNDLIDPSAGDDAIAAITGKIMTLSDVMDEEAGRVTRSARTMLVNGVAANIDQALDMINHATQEGLNSAGDLLDTIDEYSVQFSRMGLSGQESFGLIGQAMKAGARDSDIAADAIKEFAIRAQDGSVLTKRGFESIGLDAKTMGERVAAGGQSAHDALRETLNALQAMPPGVERSTAAVDLFGTKAEDMGEALFHMDLDNAAAKFGNFAGSLKESADAMSSGVSGAEKLGKGFQNAMGDVGNFLGGDLPNIMGGYSDKIDGAIGKSNEFSVAIEKWKSTGSTEWLDQLKEKYPELAGAIDQYIEKHQGEVAGHDAVTSSVQAEINTLDELIAKQQEAAGVALSARDAERNYQEAVDAASEAVKANGETHDDNTEKGRANNQALDNLAKSALDNAAAMSSNGRSTEEVTTKMGAARRSFINAAVQMGYTRAQARTLANQLGLIPRNIAINVSARTQAAAENLRAFKRAVDNIPRTITVSTYVRGANIVPGAGSGKIFVSQARGGISTSFGHAQEGGARTGSTLINEAGPEAVDLPNGSRVMTAGATRALAERGLLGDVGVLETAATGGARGRGVPAYARTGQVNIAAGQHSERFIANLLAQGWRAMDGNMNMLYSPARQRRAGAGRRFAHGDLVTDGSGGGRLESWAEAAALTGRHGTPDINMHVAGNADSAVGELINRLHRDGIIRFTVRS